MKTRESLCSISMLYDFWRMAYCASHLGMLHFVRYIQLVSCALNTLNGWCPLNGISGFVQSFMIKVESGGGGRYLRLRGTVSYYNTKYNKTTYPHLKNKK